MSGILRNSSCQIPWLQQKLTKWKATASLFSWVYRFVFNSHVLHGIRAYRFRHQDDSKDELNIYTALYENVGRFKNAKLIFRRLRSALRVGQIWRFLRACGCTSRKSRMQDVESGPIMAFLRTRYLGRMRERKSVMPRKPNAAATAGWWVLWQEKWNTDMNWFNKLSIPKKGSVGMGTHTKVLIFVEALPLGMHIQKRK